MSRIKKGWAPGWGIGFLLGMLLAIGPSAIFAQEQPPVPDEFSLKVWSSTRLTSLCTAYFSLYPQQICQEGFMFPRGRVLLDKKTGMIWMETVQPAYVGYQDPKGGPFPVFFPIVRNKVTLCKLGQLGSAGKLDPEFTVNSYPFKSDSRDSWVTCPE